MTQSLWPRENWRLITEAFFGTPAARALHERYLANPITIEAGVDVIRSRGPDVRSSDVSEPIFIFSAGWRSGSTFLQRLLMCDPDTMIWGEPYRHAEIVDSMARQLKAFTAIWPLDWFFIDHGGEDGPLTEEWIANLYPKVSDFLASHLAFFNRLFALPARERNRKRWGFKEVALTVDHACYLRWLFPKAKFLFLYRNPYDAYRSYRRWRNWYRTWPEQPVFTPGSFGKYWKDLTADFAAHYAKVDGLLIKYEELRTVDTWNRITEYLEMSLPTPDSLSQVDGPKRARAANPALRVPRFERYLLKRQVEPLGSSLGYVS
jgi:hypothetical protein